ncbi:MAG: dihydrofolate reductase [Bacteroidota bacterium]
MKVSIIAALDKNRAIGNDNKLLCYLPADLRHFKSLTTGHTIVMGRKTYESLPNGALPNRKNVVLTKNKDFMCEGCEIVHSVDEVFNICKVDEEIFIIGGAQIYKLFIEKANKLHLTQIHHEFEADTYFPEFNMNNWSIIKKEDFEPDEKNKYYYSYLDYEKNE